MPGSDLRKVQTVLTSTSGRFKRSVGWDTFFNEESIGRNDGRYWHITPAEASKLAQRYSALLGNDVRHGVNNSVNRVEMAKYASNEKLAKGNPLADNILLARALNLGIPINSTDGACFTPPGTFLASSLDNLDTTLINKVIIVENGQVMTHWHALRLPSAWAGALFVYRGHGQNARLVNDLLSASNSADVAYFCDFDPAGLNMAISAGQSVVVPKDIDLLISSGFIQKYNQEDLYFNQLSQLKAITTPEHHKLKECVERMKTHHIAIMQEHIIAHKLELDVIRV